MFAYCVSAAVSRSRFRGASQAPALRVTSSAHGWGRRTYTSRSRLRSFNRCAARLAPRAERSAWSWTSTLEIRPDLENDEIAGWRRRGHRDADARRGARFYPGRWALPHPATWRLSFHCGMKAADTSAWQGASSLRVTSSRVRCGPLVLFPLHMRETLGAQPRRRFAVTNQPMCVMLAANHPSGRRRRPQGCNPLCIVRKLAALCRRLALLGATDQEMADVLGIDQVTLDRWKA